MKQTMPLVVLFCAGVALAFWLYITDSLQDGPIEPVGMIPKQGDSPEAKVQTDQFIPVDASRLMMWPYPFKLEVAYPQLSFGYERPLQLLTAKDGTNRVFVLCQEGKIYVFENQSNTTVKKVFLDLTDRISRKGNEEGLLGIAFHPNYKGNGRLYVCYSGPGPKSVISKFEVSQDDVDLANADSEEILLEVQQPFRTQNGGSMEFGPDEFLYVGLGDGGSSDDPQEHGQNLETLLGAVLRIDVDQKDSGKKYAIPKDNPFVEKQGKTRGEIWAYGFRNIWRLSFDHKTGMLWAGDVGQNRFEEVNLIVKGANYGWNKREGTSPFSYKRSWEFPTQASEKSKNAGSKFVDPVTHYPHSEGRAIVGGRVYRGKEFPDLVGAYLYSDYSSGNIWALYYDHQNNQITKEIKICNSKLQIAGFGEDRQGELYVCSFDGNIYRFSINEDYLKKGPSKFPTKLSETGLFKSTKELLPSPGMIPYSVNVPLWSDDANKGRYFTLPEQGKVEFSESGIWKFPVGTIVVKSFFLNMRQGNSASQQRVETRLLVHGPDGWDGYTYHWNDTQDDAMLMDAASTIPMEIETAEGQVVQDWYFPSRPDCKACHTKAGGFVLSLNTRQMNRDHAYASGTQNQLLALENMGVFSKPLPTSFENLEAYPDWDSASEPVENLARAYLDVNCSFCHAPGGPGNSPIDLRYHTPLNQMALIGIPPRGTRIAGPPATAILTPHRPGDSEILRRMELRGPGQMPVFATFLRDQKAVNTISNWINTLDVER